MAIAPASMPPGAPGAQGQPPGTPPIGSSPVTGPTANLGVQAAAVQGVGLLIKLSGELIPRVGASSPIGMDLAKMITMLGKHVQPGAVSPAAENNQLENLRMKQMTMAPQMAALRAQGGPPGGGAPPGGPPGGAPPMPPQA